MPGETVERLAAAHAKQADVTVGRSARVPRQSDRKDSGAVRRAQTIARISYKGRDAGKMLCAGAAKSLFKYWLGHKMAEWHILKRVQPVKPLYARFSAPLRTEQADKPQHPPFLSPFSQFERSDRKADRSIK